MHLLAPSTPRTGSGRAIDIVDAAPEAGVSRGFARVDLRDPVFFDHPLDHVPGMLLVAAGLELADHAGMLQSDDVNFRLSFTRFCELDAPVEVTAVHEFAGDRIEFSQSDRTIAQGTLRPCDIERPAEVSRLPALRDGAIGNRLVHRTDPGNVVLGPLTVRADRVWARVGEQAAVDGMPPRASVVTSLIEAARQFTIAILHRWGQHPMGTKMIFVGLTADLPTAVPLGHRTRALSWRITSAHETRKLHLCLHATGGQPTTLGSVVIATRCVDDVAYAQLRAG